MKIIPSYNFATCFKYIWAPRVVVKQVSNRRHVLVVVLRYIFAPCSWGEQQNLHRRFPSSSFFCSKEIASFFIRSIAGKSNSTKEPKRVYRKAHTWEPRSLLALSVIYCHTVTRKCKSLERLTIRLDKTSCRDLQSQRVRKKLISDQLSQNHELSLVSMVWAKSNSFWNRIIFDFLVFTSFRKNYFNLTKNL